MPWQKGQSGNPGGRPKAVEGLAELIRKELKDGTEAVKKLLDILQYAPDHGHRIHALKVLLEYGYGKPSQNVNLATENPLRIIVETGVIDPDPPKAEDGRGAD